VDAEPSFLLTTAYNESRGKARAELLDLSMFTDPPAPYVICKSEPVVVKNPKAPAELFGVKVVAGMPVELWDVVIKNAKLLPLAAQVGSAVGYFYQAHKDSIDDLAVLERFLLDETGVAKPPAANPRRRVVIFVQFPMGLVSDNRRFAKKKTPQVTAPVQPIEGVVVIDEASNIPAVYEWWQGPSPMQSVVPQPPEGRWKRYHPEVCRRLERAFQNDSGFKSGTVPADVDGLRYMIQHIFPESPFDYRGKASREPFPEGYQITIEHPCFTDIDKASSNCFVQFQKGNPYRRRPARRRPDASEIARSQAMTGQPCMICFSEDGHLTGCTSAHVICTGCLRAALMAMAGDATNIESLICGCFSSKSRKALMVLAEHADVSLHADLERAATSTDKIFKADLDMEMVQVRSRFDLGPGSSIPPNVFREKITEWFKKVFINDIGHLYYPCQHPACANEVDHWILIEDFERDYQSRHQTTWVCPAGHANSVLPTQEELDQMNKNLLMHPEYYTQSSEYDRCPLRRYRLCQECLEGGALMLAVHNEGCKQWPGAGRGHQHVFCFHCTRRWGQCDHRTQCVDPGIQQVRKVDDHLEIGFVAAPAFLSWVAGGGTPPPTVYGPTQEDGTVRQERLGLDRSAIRQESSVGTL